MFDIIQIQDWKSTFGWTSQSESESQLGDTPVPDERSWMSQSEFPVPGERSNTEVLDKTKHSKIRINSHQSSNINS